MASPQLAIQNVTTVGARAVKLHIGFPTVVNSTAHSNLYFDWPIPKEVVKKMSNSCHKLIKNFVQAAMVGSAAL